MPSCSPPPPCESRRYLRATPLGQLRREPAAYLVPESRAAHFRLQRHQSLTTSPNPAREMLPPSSRQAFLRPVLVTEPPACRATHSLIAAYARPDVADVEREVLSFRRNADSGRSRDRWRHRVGCAEQREDRVARNHLAVLRRLDRTVAAESVAHRNPLALGQRPVAVLHGQHQVAVDRPRHAKGRAVLVFGLDPAMRERAVVA